MKTVLRLGDSMEITHIHYDRNVFLPKEQYATVNETEITPEMVDNYLEENEPSDIIANIVNGELTLPTLKLAILVKSDFKITPHIYHGK